MNNKLLILCDSTYGMVAKEIAQSMNCFEQIDVLTSRYGISEESKTIVKLESAT